MALTEQGRNKTLQNVERIRQQRASKAVDYLRKDFTAMTDFELLSIILTVLGLVLIASQKSK